MKLINNYWLLIYTNNFAMDGSDESINKKKS